MLFWDFGNDRPDSDGLYFCVAGQWDLRLGDHVLFGLDDGGESLYERGVVREVGASEGYRFVRVEVAT